MAMWKVGCRFPSLVRAVLSAPARRCTASVAAVNVDAFQRTRQDYANALPFSAIPGPKGLPYIGTLLEYTRGRTFVCVFSAPRHHQFASPPLRAWDTLTMFEATVCRRS